MNLIMIRCALAIRFATHLIFKVFAPASILGYRLRTLRDIIVIVIEIEIVLNAFRTQYSLK